MQIIGGQGETHLASTARDPATHRHGTQEQASLELSEASDDTPDAALYQTTDDKSMFVLVREFLATQPPASSSWTHVSRSLSSVAPQRSPTQKPTAAFDQTPLASGDGGTAWTGRSAWA